MAARAHGVWPRQPWRAVARPVRPRQGSAAALQVGTATSTPWACCGVRWRGWKQSRGSSWWHRRLPRDGGGRDASSSRPSCCALSPASRSLLELAATARPCSGSSSPRSHAPAPARARHGAPRPCCCLSLPRRRAPAPARARLAVGAAAVRRARVRASLPISCWSSASGRGGSCGRPPPFPAPCWRPCSPTAWGGRARAAVVGVRAYCSGGGGGGGAGASPLPFLARARGRVVGQTAVGGR